MSATTTQQPRQNGRDVLVAFQTDQGIRVYSPVSPKASFFVTGTFRSPNCTCPEFQGRNGNPDFRCQHIKAVEAQLPQEENVPDEAEIAYAEAEREGMRSEEPLPAVPAATAPTMVLKRSVSPDGRINSLSVEFTCPFHEASIGEIKSRAEKTLSVQEAIVGRFLELHMDEQESKTGTGDGNGAGSGNDGSVPGKLLKIEGMNTRFGWKLFLSVAVDGEVLKFFGTKKQIAEAITATGRADLAKNISSGVELNLPCRVITRESGDGKYTNVETILPGKNGHNGRRNGS